MKPSVSSAPAVVQFESPLNEIVAILSECHGRSRAITARELSALLYECHGIYLCERGVRERIAEAELRDDFPLLLGAIGGEGYFVVAHLDEAVRRKLSLAGQIEQLAQRLDAFDRRARKLGFNLNLPAVE